MDHVKDAKNAVLEVLEKDADEDREDEEEDEEEKLIGDDDTIEM